MLDPLWERSSVMRVLFLAVVVALAAVGCGGDNPVAPTPTVSSVTVAPATPNQTIFIGQTAQFTATSTLSNGQTETRAGTWGSDNPAVATVDQNGLVTAVAAGEATIFVDVNPRGAVLIRVFPNFGGTWAGNEILTACQDSGDFAGFCAEPGLFPIGTVGGHGSMFTQNRASVDAVIQAGDGTTASSTGTVTTDGELRLPTAPVLPAEPLINGQIQNWSSRADVPSQMTGTYDAFFTAPGVTGSVEIAIRLEDVVQTSTSMGAVFQIGRSQRGRSLVDSVKGFLAASR